MKNLINKLLGVCGVRLVSKNWGPRDYKKTLKTIIDSGLEIEQVIDVGASDGSWTRECANLLKNAKFFMIDPLPSNHGKLLSIAQIGKGYGVFSGAVGSDGGMLDLYECSDQSSFYTSEFAKNKSSSIKVRVKTLDDLLKESAFSPPDFIKFDIQGHELEALRGATKCLETAKILLIETHVQRSYQETPFLHEIVSYLAQFDFQVFDFCSYVQRPVDGRLTQTDIMFAKHLPQLFSTGWNEE